LPGPATRKKKASEDGNPMRKRKENTITRHLHAEKESRKPATGMMGNADKENYPK